MSENAGIPDPIDPQGRPAEDGASPSNSLGSDGLGNTDGAVGASTPDTTPTQPAVAPIAGQPVYERNPSTQATAPQPTPAFPNYGQGAFGHPTAPTSPIAEPVPASSRTDAPRRRGGVAVVAALAVGALIGGASGAGISVWALSQGAKDAPVTASSPSTITIKNADDANLVTAIAAKASPSVVTISVSGGSSAGTGSGVILSSDGYVLTNTHVVTLDGTTASPTIRVTDSSGKSYGATVIGTDPVADLAVVKLSDASGLTPIEFGDSSSLSVGDTVVAIGAPLGLSGTVTNGIVSALNRGITIASSAAPDDGTNSTPDDGNGFKFDIPGQQQQSSASSTISLSVIQTDAAINPGNSGGALVDDEGKLIGINVAIASASDDSSSQSGNIGVGFSIPANFAQRIANEIIQNGSATHGLLGASVGATPTDSSSTSTPAGAYVSAVTSGGAAEKAGLAAGDIITDFNGANITDATDLTAQVRMVAGGSTAQLTYVRGGQSHTVTVTLGQLSTN